VLDNDKEMVQAIAKAVVQQVHDSKHAFWVEPEQHYQDHLAMREMAKTFTTTRSLFFKFFLGFAIVGSIVLAAIGMGAGKIFGK